MVIPNTSSTLTINNSFKITTINNPLPSKYIKFEGSRSKYIFNSSTITNLNNFYGTNTVISVPSSDKTSWNLPTYSITNIPTSNIMFFQTFTNTYTPIKNNFILWFLLLLIILILIILIKRN
jgi:hypothetical protein